MSEMRTVTSAIVTLTIEVNVGSTWGPNVTAAQVYSQAKTDAEGIVRKAFNQNIVIIGPLTVKAITTEMQR